MDTTIKCFAVLALTASLGACGYKSDLILPDNSNPDELFVPDSPPAEGAMAEKPPFLPNNADGIEVMTDEIVIEKVTTEATDGRILVDPDGEEEGNDGVPVDFSELVDELEGGRQSQ